MAHGRRRWISATIHGAGPHPGEAEEPPDGAERVREREEDREDGGDLVARRGDAEVEAAVDLREGLEDPLHASSGGGGDARRRRRRAGGGPRPRGSRDPGATTSPASSCRRGSSRPRRAASPTAPLRGRRTA